MKTIVLLGPTSMLGREVMKQLDNVHQYQIILAGRAENCDIFVDLGSASSPRASQGLQADVLIHCAASFGGDDPEGIRTNFRVNTQGQIDVLEIARKLGIRRIIYAGSLFSDASLEPDQPLNSYGMSKREAECILDWGMAVQGGSFCSLRLTQLLDTAGGCCRHQPWFGRIVAYASRGQTLRMPTAEGPRNFLHVADAGKLMIAAAESDITGNYVVSAQHDTDLHTLAQNAYALFNQGGEVSIAGDKTPFRKIAFPHDDLIYHKLGIQPDIDAFDTLRMIHAAGTANHFGPMDVH
jgi:nucleoside-diphosphate-sugar epimerase